MATAFSRSMLLLLALCAVMLAPREAASAEAKQSAMVIDANTGKVLHAQFADEPRFPASLTKMMTLYMLFGEIEAGRLSYDSMIKISARANGMAPSKLGLDVGEEISVLDAIKALVTKSANDVAVAIAEHIGGSEYQFASMMTERAQQISMTSTTFRNASGLPNPNQKSTARDMCTLALRLQDDFPKHYRLFATNSFTFRGKTYKTHNTLMLGFPGMDGIKTGYTRASGFNLVSSVRTDNKHLVAAVFGGKTAASRNAHMRMLLFRALESASTQKTRKPAQQLIALPKPVARPPSAPAPTEVAWATETKEAPAPAKPVKTVAVKTTPVKTAPPKAPAPVAAPAPTPALRPTHDPISQVLAQGDTQADAPAAVADAASAASSAHPPRLDLQALRAAMSEGEPEPTAAQTRSLQASTAAGPQDIAALIRNSIVDGAPQGAVRPPSTLDSQASALMTASTSQGTTRVSDASDTARPSAPKSDVPPSYLKGPVPSGKPFAAAPLGQGYEIQIGAYGTVQEAQSKLELVRGRAVGLLEGHSSVTLPVQRESRQIFRARFVHFDEQGASNTCLELRRLAIDCFVMKAE